MIIRLSWLKDQPLPKGESSVVLLLYHIQETGDLVQQGLHAGQIPIGPLLQAGQSRQGCLQGLFCLFDQR